MAKGIVGEAVSTKGTGPRTPLGKLLAAGMKILEQPQVEDALLKAAMSEDPAEELSSIAKMILDTMDDKAKGTIPPDALTKFSLELVKIASALVLAARGEDDPSLGPRTMQRLLEKSMEEGQQQGQPGQPPQGQPPEQAMMAQGA